MLKRIIKIEKAETNRKARSVFLLDNIHLIQHLSGVPFRSM